MFDLWNRFSTGACDDSDTELLMPVWDTPLAATQYMMANDGKEAYNLENFVFSAP